ncbi:hypothetical protein [Rhodococcus sp. ACT016]|uniref:hypothetical protein n=1 Tax=Rhodococcus sp. ACT016 TaxID=3134808 RepID=UPI003D2E4210
MGETSNAAVVAAALLVTATLSACGADSTDAGSTSAPETATAAAATDGVDCPTTGIEFDPAHAGPADEMVPGTPVSATICRYDAPAGQEADPAPTEPVMPPLTRSGRLEGDDLARVVSALNAGEPANPRACGLGFPPTSIVYATFEYADRPSVTIESWEPCGQSSNGTRLAVAPQASLSPWWD